MSSDILLHARATCWLALFPLSLLSWSFDCYLVSATDVYANKLKVKNMLVVF